MALGTAWSGLERPGAGLTSTAGAGVGRALRGGVAAAVAAAGAAGAAGAGAGGGSRVGLEALAGLEAEGVIRLGRQRRREQGAPTAI